MGVDRNEGKWMQTQGGGHVIICVMAVFNFDPCSRFQYHYIYWFTLCLNNVGLFKQRQKLLRGNVPLPCSVFASFKHATGVSV